MSEAQFARVFSFLVHPCDEVVYKALDAIFRWASRVRVTQRPEIWWVKRKKLVDLGVIPVLVKLFAQTNPPSTQIVAVSFLEMLIDANTNDVIRSVSGVAALVALVADLPGSGPSHKAVYAIGRMAMQNKESQDDILQSGGVGATLKVIGSGILSETETSDILLTLRRLVIHNTKALQEIRVCGGIPLLLVCQKTRLCYETATEILCMMACDASNNDALAKEQTVETLVAILHAESPSTDDLRHRARGALMSMAMNHPDTTKLVMRTVTEKLPLIHKQAFIENLKAVTIARLRRATKTLDINRLIDCMELISVEYRLDESTTCDGSLISRKRSAVEFEDIPGLPNEFLCPITLDKMIDPVVASDGNSYERAAIEAVIQQACQAGDIALSPLSREPISQWLYLNRNLRQRIDAHV